MVWYFYVADENVRHKHIGCTTKKTRFTISGTSAEMIYTTSVIHEALMEPELACDSPVEWPATLWFVPCFHCAPARRPVVGRIYHGLLQWYRSGCVRAKVLVLVSGNYTVSYAPLGHRAPRAIYTCAPRESHKDACMSEYIAQAPSEGETKHAIFYGRQLQVRTLWKVDGPCKRPRECIQNNLQLFRLCLCRANSGSVVTDSRTEIPALGGPGVSPRTLSLPCQTPSFFSKPSIPIATSSFINVVQMVSGLAKIIV